MTAKTPNEFKQELAEILVQKSKTARKTFFSKLISGQLSRAALQEYYRHLYHECSAFGRFLGLVYATTEPREVRQFLSQNLMVEFGYGKPGKDHPGLAMHLGRSLGLSEKEIEDHGLYPEVAQAFEKLRELGLSSFLEGLGVLLTIEADLPLRHAATREALMTHYGLKDEDLGYYHEHMGSSDGSGDAGDEPHVASEMDLLAKFARTEQEQNAVRRAIDVTFEARNQLVLALESHCLPLT